MLILYHSCLESIMSTPHLIVIFKHVTWRLVLVDDRFNAKGHWSHCRSGNISRCDFRCTIDSSPDEPRC